jgi:RNA polymerase sigma-70 factor, ECF subfamily
MAIEQVQSGPEAEPEVHTSTSGSVLALNPERWVEEYGDLLFGFAMVRVRDRGVAQELVQDTFLAALQASQSFAGRSNEKAWLFGILRHKMVDHFRRKSREIEVADLEPGNPEEEGFFHTSGPGKDGWIRQVAPQSWDAPDESLVSKEFQAAFSGCISQLPERTAQVFLLREVDGVSSEEICKDLSVSANNLWVMLHRARIALRRCLEVHWFGHAKTKQRGLWHRQPPFGRGP